MIPIAVPSGRAPPIAASLAFFYPMPLFLGLAGLVLAWQGDQVVASRWSPAALAATHFIVLGAFTPVMCGALMQISQVLLGVSYPRARLTAFLTTAGLVPGGLLIGSGFLFSFPGLLVAGGALTVAGLLVFFVVSYTALRRAAGERATRWAVRLAVLALMITVTLGMTGALSRLGWLELPQHAGVIDTHAAWGLAGWVGLLLAGVGMELIPLFYLTPVFGKGMRDVLPFAVFGLLVAFAGVGLEHAWGAISRRVTLAMLLFIFLLVCAAMLRMLYRRQRLRRDATFWLWWTSCLLIPAAGVAWIQGTSQSTVGILLLGACLSFMIGALFKIVPFLNWLDLQQRRTTAPGSHHSLPSLGALLPEAYSNAIVLTLEASLVALLSASLIPLLAHLGGFLLLACAGQLAYILIRAAWLRGAAIQNLARS